MDLSGLQNMVTALVVIMAAVLMIAGIIKLFKGQFSWFLGMFGGGLLLGATYAAIVGYATIGPAVLGLVT